jgi:hypothetical protein
MKLLHESKYWHGAGSTILLIKEDFPVYTTHSKKKKDDKEIIHGADSNYLLSGVTKTPGEKLGAKLSVSVRSVYKPFSSTDEVRSTFLRRIGA